MVYNQKFITRFYQFVLVVEGLDSFESSYVRCLSSAYFCHWVLLPDKREEFALPRQLVCKQIWIILFPLVPFSPIWVERNYPILLSKLLNSIIIYFFLSTAKTFALHTKPLHTKPHWSIVRTRDHMGSPK